MAAKTCDLCQTTSSEASFTHKGEECRICGKWFCLSCVRKQIHITNHYGCLNCGNPFTSFTEGN